MPALHVVSRLTRTIMRSGIVQGRLARTITRSGRAQLFALPRLRCAHFGGAVSALPT